MTQLRPNVPVRRLADEFSKNQLKPPEQLPVYQEAQQQQSDNLTEPGKQAVAEQERNAPNCGEAVQERVSNHAESGVNEIRSYGLETGRPEPNTSKNSVSILDVPLRNEQPEASSAENVSAGDNSTEGCFSECQGLYVRGKRRKANSSSCWPVGELGERYRMRQTMLNAVVSMPVVKLDQYKSGENRMTAPHTRSPKSEVTTKIEASSLASSKPCGSSASTVKNFPLVSCSRPFLLNSCAPRIVDIWKKGKVVTKVSIKSPKLFLS